MRGASETKYYAPKRMDILLLQIGTAAKITTVTEFSAAEDLSIKDCGQS